MRRLPISTRVVATVLVIGVALVWGRASDWCVWWQVAYVVTALLIIGLLSVREVNRARIKERQMLDRLNEQGESVRASIDESQAKSAAQMNQFRRDMLREFGKSGETQQRILEAVAPSYERPQVANLAASVDLGGITINAAATLAPQTRREWLRHRLMYILRWVWGTHDAPPAKDQKS